MAGCRVGVVGLGAMGAPIAWHLARSGHEVTGYDVRYGAAAEAVEAGAVEASRLEDVAGADVVLLLVPTDDDILDVGGRLAPALAAGAVLVICSSALPETCRRLAELGREHGVAVVDAALTGGVRAAEAGTISLLVGGDEPVVARLEPVFAAFCARVSRLGPLGAGQVGKTVNNLLHWATIAAITEAFTLGERLGVPAPRLREALLDGPTDSRTMRELDRFRLTWWAKDLDNALAMAGDAAVELPLTRAVRAAMPAISVEVLAGFTDVPCNG